MRGLIYSLSVAAMFTVIAVFGPACQVSAESDVAKKLARQRIYFGHMSVGNNIVMGIEELRQSDPSLKIRVVEISGPARVKPGTLAHGRVGKNGAPKSKIDAFKAIMSNGLGNEVDIAMFKFCYIDIMEHTDVEDLFRHYKSSMAELKRKFPRVKFVHVTSPVRVVQRGWKAVVKKVANTPVGGYADNINRNLFNELLRKEYAGKEPILDLELWESTYPDGSRSFFQSNGRTYYSLVQEYTFDGGHLNESGRKAIAAQFLEYLSNL